MTQLDADTLRVLASVVHDESTIATRAALYAKGQILLTAYIWNDITGNDFLDALVEFMNVVELLPDDDERSD